MKISCRVIYYKNIQLDNGFVKVDQSNILDVPLRACGSNEQRDPRGRCRKIAG